MKKLLSTSVLGLAVGVSFNAMAAFQGPEAGVTTVAEALKMRDDSPVVLTGQIEKNLGNEKYQFKDATGTVVVDIDNEDWRGVDVTPANTITIRGEVDKDMFTTEIDVDSVELKN